eukprot:TRINITY_DN4569_c0_g1_i1.p1 TRINITY_DN4569_c0_g1~~TRINITY_DN4569_c0_g1_i1.p1  ORF type:complete len:241 (-),score=92.17 TRINITY_DN4569_c0_g1_i1:83-742(-)
MAAIEGEEADWGDDWEDEENPTMSLPEPPPKKVETKTTEERKIDELVAKFTGQGSQAATARLQKDLRHLLRHDISREGFSAIPVEDNLYHWKVEFFDFPNDCELYNDLKTLEREQNVRVVEFEMRFSSDYPFAPPFVRVVYPRFQFRTGHITIGGSICMEVLTPSGWLPSNDIESLLVQIKSEMIAGGARIDFNNRNPYSEREAREAFERVARHHGWIR